MLSNNTGCFFLRWSQGEGQILQISNLTQGQVDALLYGKRKCMKLWDVVAPVLLLSHGNASVERGFSVNRQIEVENMKEGTYRAQRLVSDHLRSVGGVDNFVVTKALLKSASSARQRYVFHLEEQKRQKVTEKLNTKWKVLFDASSLEQSADEFVLKAEDLGIYFGDFYIYHQIKQSETVR